MRINSFLNTKFVTQAGIFICRILSPSAAKPLINGIARYICRQKSMSIVKALKSNIQVVLQVDSTDPLIDHYVYQIMRNQIAGLYDFYHHIQDPAGVLKKVWLSDRFQGILDAQKTADKGLLLLIPHMGNFDFAGRGLALRGYQLTILSYPNPPSGYVWQNKLREEVGMEVVPMSIQALRVAGQRLQENKIVLTGVDRPLEKSNYPIRFFGKSTFLPVTPARLALKYDANVAICASIAQKDGTYCIDSSEVFRMERNPNLAQELVINMESILSRVEPFIKNHLDQWSMFYPVWE